MPARPVFALFALTAAAAPALAQLAPGGTLDPSILPGGGQIHSIDVDGELAVVGVTSGLAGSAVVFEHGPTGWVETAVITDPSPLVGAVSYTSGFGYSVGISGTTIVIGDLLYSEGLIPGGNPPCCDEKWIGAVYTYELIADSWQQTGFFVLPDNGHRDNNQFGEYVQISGDTIFASQTNAWGGDFQSWHGEITRIERSGGSWSMAETFSLPSWYYQDIFQGRAMDGDTFLAISDPLPDDLSSAIAEVSVYERSGSSWTLAAVLPEPPGLEIDDGFGYSADVDGDIIVVGARYTDGRGNKPDAGKAYVYGRDPQGNWYFAQEIEAGDASAGAQFGFSVAIDGDTILVGARDDADLHPNGGAVYEFKLAGGSFIEVAKHVPGTNADDDQLGSSVAISGADALMFAAGEDTLGSGAGRVYAYGCAGDTDGDGLCDEWETLGVPYWDSSGTLQRYVLDIDGDGISDADPMHKDLFVEVDSMTGLSFPLNSKDMVETAFIFAPVSNPDSIEGIELHIEIDQTNLPFEDTVTTKSGIPSNFEGFRFGFFGTLDDQSSPDSTARLNARAKAFRYCVVANDGEYLDENNNPVPIGGIAELPGDDLVIYAGGTGEEDTAAVFMHELGHTLGLGHGGGDSINGKPNYPSIMNYVYAYRAPWNTDFWILDYCREQLPTLNEASLDETTPPASGSTGQYFDTYIPFGGTIADNAPCWPESLWGERITTYLSLNPEIHADFNIDCDFEDSGVVQDLTNLVDATVNGAPNPSPNDPLPGHNDWANLRLAVSDGGGAFKGALPRSPEPSLAVRDFIQNLPPPSVACSPADVTTTGAGAGDPSYGVPDGAVTAADLNYFVNAYIAADLAVADVTTQGAGPGDPGYGVPDGIVTAADINYFVNLWVAGCP